MKEITIKQKLNESNNTEDIGVDKSKNSLGFLVATLIIIFCVSSVAIDTILTKKSINKQLDVIESRLVSVDQKLDEIVLFLQTGHFGVSVKPILLTTEYDDEVVDSLKLEVKSVQNELDDLKKSIN